MRPVRRAIKGYSSVRWSYLAIGVQILVLSGTTTSEPVPDTKGTMFLFSTPLCTDDSPAQMHIIPQTTEAVNVTLESLETNTQFTGSKHTIRADDSLHLPLPCLNFEWGKAKSAGLLLESSSEITVYIDYKDDNYFLIPMDTFGYNYIVTSVTTLKLQESFLVVHGNNSLIQLTLPEGIQSPISVSGNQYQGGSIINVSLPSNGVIGIKCSCDLTGATVNSDLPISVLVGSTDSISANTIIEQLPAKNTWGRKFLFSNSRWFAQNITLKITGEEPNTALTIRIKDKTERLSFPRTLVHSMQLDFSDFLSLQTNTSVSCVIAYQIIDEQNARHMAISFLTPIELFHTSSSFTFNTFDTFASNLILMTSSLQYVSFNSTASYPFDNAMTYWWDFFICNDIPLSRPHQIKTNSKNSVPFYGTILRRNNNSAYEYHLGMRVTSLYNSCLYTLRTHGGNGDGIDNDCDNRIDEEKLNNIDDDNDGLTDEDTAYAGIIAQHSHETAWEYHQSHKEKDEKFSTSAIRIVIPLSAALTLIVILIGGMLIADKLRRSNAATRVTPLYLQQQQEPILQRDRNTFQEEIKRVNDNHNGSTNERGNLNKKS